MDNFAQYATIYILRSESVGEGETCPTCISIYQSGFRLKVSSLLHVIIPKMYKIDRRRIHLKREKKKNPTKTPGANQWRTTESSEAYLENILSRCEFRYIHPLAIDVVLVHVATVHGDTLVTVVGAFVPEITQSSVAPVNWLVN